MLKKINISLLFMAIAVTAFAGENRLEVARLEKDIHYHPKSSIPTASVTEKYDYYEVKGNNEKEVRCNMTQCCRRLSDGKKYDAYTSWRWKWNYGPEHDRARNDCRTDSFSVNVEVTYHLPKWVPADGAPRQLVDKWDGYMKSLAVHERGHRDIALAAAAELSRAVAELVPTKSCADMDQEILALSRKYMNQLAIEQNEYDAETAHGVKQGALFP